MLDAHGPFDPERLVQRFYPHAQFAGGMHDLVGRRWWHMDAGAEIGHQQELNDAPFVGHVQRHDIAWQLHHLPIERLDHRRGRRLLCRGRAGLGGERIGQLRHVMYRQRRWRRRGSFRNQLRPLQQTDFSRVQG